MLDRSASQLNWGVAFLAVVGGVACTPRSEPLTPARLPALDPALAREWAAALAPDHPTRFDLQWVYETQQGRVRGRAAVRFAPPDSLRFDYRAPFGRSGAAVLIGDSLVWAEPEQEVETLIPVASLFWAALGLPRQPPAGTPVFGRERANERVWHFRSEGLEQTYIQTWGGAWRLQMELRQGESVVGAADVRLDSLGKATGSTITFPRAAARFTLTVTDNERLESIDPAVWRAP